MRTFRAGIILVATSLPVIASADAGPGPGHVDPAMVAHVTDRFSASFREGGIVGVIADVRSCYAATSSELSSENKEAVLNCLLYDYSAFKMHRAVMQVFAGSSSAGSDLAQEEGPDEFFSEDSFVQRLSRYAPIPFGNDKQAFGRYFGSSPQEVVNQVFESHE